MEDGLRMERRRSPRESRESLRQVGRAQGEVRKPKCQRRHYWSSKAKQPMNACVHTYTKSQTPSTRRRGPGWRIHGSVEDTKLRTNKQHSLLPMPFPHYFTLLPADRLLPL